MLAFGVLSLAHSAVTTALTIYGFTGAGALGAGLVGARVLPSMVAGVFGGKVARAPGPRSCAAWTKSPGNESRASSCWDAFLCSAR